ncbi:MAG: hypothetical protein ACI4NU_07905 [Christensenellales bacterium]
MKKENFVSLILGTVGGILFALGMCMCLLPDWNAFKPGLVTGVIGLAVLLAMLFVRRKMQGKPPVKLNRRTVGIIALAVLGALVLGAGMCLVMVWERLALGILVGIVGIVMLLCLIPLTKGLK